MLRLTSQVSGCEPEFYLQMCNDNCYAQRRLQHFRNVSLKTLSATFMLYIEIAELFYLSHLHEIFKDPFAQMYHIFAPIGYLKNLHNCMVTEQSILQAVP